ncbi:MAG: orotate phosphoribosyltransferase [Desulfosudaceae bacterium]
MNEKDQLIALIRERSFQEAETPAFTLASGKKSRFYFNLKEVTCSSRGQYLVGRLVYDAIQQLGEAPDGIGGLTLGADPISFAAAYTFHLHDKAIEAFVIRKEPKGHGTASQIEGHVRPGDTVIITEDVITTGGSTLKAIDAAQAYGLSVSGVIALLDRCEENGRQHIEARRMPVYPLLTIDDFR